MAVRDNASGGEGSLSGLAAISITVSAASGTLGTVSINATINNGSHRYLNSWTVQGGATSTLYLTEDSNESVLIDVSAQGFVKETRTITATTQSISITLEETVLRALVITDNKKVWLTEDGVTFTQVGTCPYEPSITMGKRTRNFDGTLVVCDSANYAYSTDEGETWAQRSAGSRMKSCASVRKINDEFYFMGELTTTSSGYYYQGYYKTSDISVAPTGETTVSVRTNTDRYGDLYDMDSDGTIFKGLSSQNVGWNGTYQAYGGYDLVYGNNIWVIRAGNGLYYSSDGSTWTQATLPVAITNDAYDNLYFINNTFICIDSYGIILKSSDGANWTAVNATQFSNHAVEFGVGPSGIFGVRKENGVNYSIISTGTSSLGTEASTDLSGTVRAVFVL